MDIFFEKDKKIFTCRHVAFLSDRHRLFREKCCFVKFD